MATDWLSRNDYAPTDKVLSEMFNSLANDDRNWGGDVNGGGHRLSNVILAGSGGFEFLTSPVQITPGTDGGSYTQYDQTGPVVGGNPTYIVRWIAGKNTVAETGANAGSDYEIRRYNDAGTLIGTPFSINRATGVISMGAQHWTGPIDGGGQTLSNISIPGMLTNPMTTVGDLIVGGAAGAPGKLGVGTNGQTLVADSTVAGIGMKWATTNPLTTAGDIIVRDAAAAARLGVGTDGQVLTVDTSLGIKLKWATAAAAATYLLDGVVKGTRPKFDIITGANVALTMVDDPGNNQVKLTIAATGGGSGGGAQTPWISDIDAAGFNLDHAGLIRSTTFTVPASGAGLELLYTGGPTGTGVINTFDRTAGVYLPLGLNGKGVTIVGQGGSTIRLDPTGGVVEVTGAGWFKGIGNLSGEGVRVGYDPTTHQGDIMSYDYVAPGFKPLGIRGNPIVMMNGNVGIGTSVPAAPLQVYIPAGTTAASFCGTAVNIYLSPYDGSPNPGGNGAQTDAALIALATANGHYSLVQGDFALATQTRIGTGGGNRIVFGHPLDNLGNYTFGMFYDHGKLGVGVNAANLPYALAVTGFQSGPPNVAYQTSALFSVNVPGNVELAVGWLGAAPYSMWLQGRSGGVSVPITLNGAGGNVGIGTVDPKATLQIGPWSGTVAGDGQMILAKSSGTGPLRAFRMGLDANYYFVLGDVGGAPSSPIMIPAITIPFGAGNVGINCAVGVAPGYTLDVKGNVNCTGQFLINGVPLSTGGGVTVQNIVTGSRVNGSAYLNSTGKAMFVNVVAFIPASLQLLAYSDATSFPTAAVAQITAPSSGPITPTISFWVLPNNYYRVVVGTGGSIGTWVEWN